MLLLLPLFGAVEALLLKRKTLIIVNNSVTGGKVNGKQQQNSLQRAQFLTTMFSILAIPKEEYNLANSQSGVKLWWPLIMIHLEVIL